MNKLLSCALLALLATLFKLTAVQGAVSNGWLFVFAVIDIALFAGFFVLLARYRDRDDAVKAQADKLKELRADLIKTKEQLTRTTQRYEKCKKIG